MTKLSPAIALSLLAAASAVVQTPSAVPPLMQHMTGHWVLRGTIDKQPATHDVDADLVLNQGYVRLHEVSREKSAGGTPQYEAFVFISVDQKTGQYNCLWLDNTSNAGLSNGGIAHGIADGNTIPFLFRLTSGEVFHTTFVYDPRADAWRWEMDGESNGQRQPFARLMLTRR